MPASLPGDTLANNQANPTAGRSVQFSLLSGPKNSPFDAQKIDYSTGTPPGWSATRIPIKVNDPLNLSTGPLSTGIGMNTNTGPIGPISNPLISNSLWGIIKAGFTDDYTPGVTKPDGTASADSGIMFIGGGRSQIVSGTGAGGNGAPANWKVSVPQPYTAGFGIGNAGNGGSRDAGAGPAFTGFLQKMVTATAGVAIGAAVEAGWTNRANRALVANESVFGSSTTASAAPA